MKKTVQIEVKEDGSLSIEAAGFEDLTCLNALKELETLFGEAKDVTIKAEGSKNRNRTIKA